MHNLTDSEADTSPIHLDLTAPLGTFRTSSQPIVDTPTTSNVIGTEASPAQPSSTDMASSKSTSISVSTRTDKSPSTSLSSAQSLDFQSTTTYQVSIKMACTHAQLDANMILLAGMGTSVTIQIEKRSLVMERME